MPVATVEALKLLLPTTSMLDKAKSQYEARIKAVGGINYSEKFIKNPSAFTDAVSRMTNRYTQAIPIPNFASLQVTRYIASQGVFEPGYDDYVAEPSLARFIAKYERKWPGRVATTLDWSQNKIKRLMASFPNVIDRQFWSMTHNVIKETIRNLVEGVTPLVRKTSQTPLPTLAAVQAFLNAQGTSLLVPPLAVVNFTLTDLPHALRVELEIA
jgi:hypothetical protein